MVVLGFEPKVFLTSKAMLFTVLLEPMLSGRGRTNGWHMWRWWKRA